MGYIRTAKNEFGPCLFCDKSHIGKDEDDLVVHRGENAYILMNLYPYNNGHLMVVPYDHEKNFDDLQPDTQVEMMNLMSQAMGVLRESLDKSRHLESGKQSSEWCLSVAWSYVR